jgi:F0F1-type ATP synthase membrane subunit b/b'
MFNSRLAPAVAILSLAVAQLLASTVSLGHPQAKTTASTAKKEVAGQTDELARLREQLVQATKEYKASLEQLLALYEAEVSQADNRVNKTRELYRAGLAMKRDLEYEEQAAEQARGKVARVQEQLKSADVQIAETLAEATSEETARKGGAIMPKDLLSQISPAFAGFMLGSISLIAFLSIRNANLAGRTRDLCKTLRRSEEDVWQASLSLQLLYFVKRYKHNNWALVLAIVSVLFFGAMIGMTVLPPALSTTGVIG